MDSSGNGQEWARESITGLREDIRGIRKETARERARSDRNHETVLGQLQGINSQISEMRGASKLAGALWGGMTSATLAMLAKWAGVFNGK